MVDWSQGAKTSVRTFDAYYQSAANTRLVGAQIAFLVQALEQEAQIPQSSVHIIGLSLGAQIAGYAGKRLSGLGRITGIESKRLQILAVTYQRFEFLKTETGQGAAEERDTFSAAKSIWKGNFINQVFHWKTLVIKIDKSLWGVGRADINNWFRIITPQPFGLNMFYYFNFTISIQTNTYSTSLGIGMEAKCLLSSSP